jgi:hypothetical protein
MATTTITLIYKKDANGVQLKKPPRSRSVSRCTQPSRLTPPCPGFKVTTKPVVMSLCNAEPPSPRKEG